MSANRTSKFAFLDEGEAIRLLGVDRDTLLTFVREKRLRSYPGVGKGHFFRVSDLEKLAAELHPAAEPTEAPNDEPAAQRRTLPVMQAQVSTQTPQQAQQGAAQAPMQILTPQSVAARKPQHDPAYKVHLRLTADLKWFDITDADLRSWVRELHPDAYRRYRNNINAVIAKLETLREQMDEAASHWKNLPSEDAPPSPEPPADSDR